MADTETREVLVVNGRVDGDRGKLPPTVAKAMVARRIMGFNGLHRFTRNRGTEIQREQPSVALPTSPFEGQAELWWAGETVENGESSDSTIPLANQISSILGFSMFQPLVKSRLPSHRNAKRLPH